MNEVKIGGSFVCSNCVSPDRSRYRPFHCRCEKCGDYLCSVCHEKHECKKDSIIEAFKNVEVVIEDAKHKLDLNEKVTQNFIKEQELEVSKVLLEEERINLKHKYDTLNDDMSRQIIEVSRMRREVELKLQSIEEREKKLEEREAKMKEYEDVFLVKLTALKEEEANVQKMKEKALLSPRTSSKTIKSKTDPKKVISQTAVKH